MRSSIVWVVALAMHGAGCGGQDAAGLTPPECQEAPEQVSRPVPGSNGLGEIKVVATRGCADLDVPIAAMNWYSVSNADALAAYNDVVGPEVFKLGARVLVVAGQAAALDVPEGKTPSGGPFVQDELAIPLYPSADAFIGMVTSPAFQAAPPKGNGVENHYEFSFQECLANCDPGGPQLPSAMTGVIVLQHLLVDRSAVVASLEKLKSVIYAGYRLADIRLSLGGQEGPLMEWMEPAWADATVVYQVADEAAAEQLMKTDAFVNLNASASQHAVTQLKPIL